MANENLSKDKKPKFDRAYKETENVLAEIEAEIESIYGQSYRELKDEVDKFIAQFAEADIKKREALEVGEITKEEYQRWRQTKLMVGQYHEDMLKNVSYNLTHTKDLAISTVNGYMPEVYAINGNFTFYKIEKHFGISTTFTPYNEQAVERIVRENPHLLPKKKVIIAEETEYQRRKLNNQIAIGIINGDTIDVIAERLRSVSDMSYNNSITNAATMTTAAQNGGRMDAYRRAQKMGIKLKHRWLATLDGHTRASHRAVDGEVVEVGEKFSNGLEFPGDPNGAPEEVYRCRCCDIAAFDDSEFDGAKGRFSRLPEDMTYEEWKTAKGVEPFFKAAQNVNRNMDMHEEYTSLYKEYKAAFSRAVPERFSDFQELKYNDTDAWKQMVSDARTARLGYKNPQLYAQKIAAKNAAKAVDNKGGSGIIKSIDIDDFKLMASAGNRNIDSRVIDTIADVIQKYEKSGKVYINDFYFGSLKAEKSGIPLLQIEPVADKTLRLNVNTDIFDNMTLEEINKKLASFDVNLAQNLEEAVIHECGHAKSIKGKSISEIKTFYSKISNAKIVGISEAAYNDGAEALAEIEVLISRNSDIPKEAKDFYNKYMKG